MDIIDTKPELFFKPDSSIWTDPYIQQNLLDAHLNPDSDAASRNSLAIKKTVSFINDQIGNHSHILDLGCGPGLYAKLFNESGHRVTGVDFNEKAVEYASAHNPTDCFIHADYLKDFPAGQYDAITMIYCDMGTHPDRDRDVLLTHCYNALNQGGKLIFDIFNENITHDKKEGKDWQYSAGSGFWSREPHLILQQTFHYPENRAFAYQYNLITDNETKYFLIWERYYTEAEIRAVLEKIGFRNIVIEMNLLESNNFTSNNEMFIVAEK